MELWPSVEIKMKFQIPGSSPHRHLFEFEFSVKNKAETGTLSMESGCEPLQKHSTASKDAMPLSFRQFSADPCVRHTELSSQSSLLLCIYFPYLKVPLLEPRVSNKRLTNLCWLPPKKFCGNNSIASSQLSWLFRLLRVESGGSALLV